MDIKRWRSERESDRLEVNQREADILPPPLEGAPAG
jgi:hypothetical protein